MIATKDNKVYTVSDTDKRRYLDAGFDIYDDDGTLIEYGRGKTVSYDEYAKLKAELEKLKENQGGTEGAEDTKSSKKGK